MSMFSVASLSPAMRDVLASNGLMSEAARILPFSLLSVPRLRGIVRAVRMLGDLAGDTAEIGCNAGGTSRLIALLNGKRRHWACDTFEGLVDVGDQDGEGRIVNGAFSNRLSKFDDVSERMSDLPHVRVVKGYLPGDAPSEMSSARFALVHIDVDTYRSIHSCFAFFAERMVAGGIIILDDVIGKGTEGGKLAWSEIKGCAGFRIVEENDPQVIVQFV
jgi:O-methyltransferase